MAKKKSMTNIEAVERRERWRDRRQCDGRRNTERLRLGTYDCRSGGPRRNADVAGELSDGKIWWSQSVPHYE